MEVALAVDALPQQRVALGRRPADVQRVAAVRGRLEGLAAQADVGVRAGHVDVGAIQVAGHLHALGVGGVQAHVQIQDVGGRAGEVQRQGQLQALLRAGRQPLGERDRDAARRAGTQRIDAQAEVLAGGLLKQRRIHAAAHHILEHLAAAGLGNGHRGAHRAVAHVEREAGDGLPGMQREPQLAFEYARVGIGQRQVDDGVHQAALGVHVHAGVDQANRLLARGDLHQRRFGPRWHALRHRLRHGQAQPGDHSPSSLPHRSLPVQCRCGLNAAAAATG